MNRREFGRLGWATLIAARAGKPRPASAQAPATRQIRTVATSDPEANARAADFTLRIAPMLVELAPKIVISTIGYNDRPRPRPAHARRQDDHGRRDQRHRCARTGALARHARPVGSRWRRRGRHSPFRPAGAADTSSLRACRYALVSLPLRPAAPTCTAAFTPASSGSYVEGANNPGNYDQELFLAFRDWEPFFSDMDSDETSPIPACSFPKSPPRHNRPNGLGVGYRIFSINDKSLGGGDPIQVKPGQRVMMHLLNASATANHRIAFPAHKFLVTAMDGNPVPTPKAVDVLEFGPGERFDAIVEMNRPGVWILGNTQDRHPQDGMGVLFEYPNQGSDRTWLPPPMTPWDYNIFGRPVAAKAPDKTVEIIVEKVPGGPGKFNQWMLNGKQYPHDNEFVFEGGRYRLVFHNRSDDAHPVHLHRHDSKSPNSTANQRQES